jgi:hydrogenase maturation protein HypF
VINAAPVIDGILRDLRDGYPVSGIAAAFHLSVAEMIVETVSDLAGPFGCTTAVASGGVFQNRLLCEMVLELSRDSNIEILMHRTVPPNDGGISLGQVQVAAARIAGDGS